MVEIPNNGYIFYKNILLLTKKSYYVLLTEFNNLELKYIQEKTGINFEIEEYKKDDLLYWVLRINGTEKQIDITKKCIENTFLKFDIWINSKNQHIYRIDPNIMNKIIKKFKNYIKNNDSNIYYCKSILLISGNNKNVVNQTIKDIEKYINKLNPCMRFIWVKMPDFLDILYRMQPLCKNRYTNFKFVPSKSSIFSENTLKTHILIYSDELFIDKIWKSINIILENMYKNDILKDDSNIKYLNLFTNYNNDKKIYTNRYRKFNPKKDQIPIHKENRNDNILSCSI